MIKNAFLLLIQVIEQHIIKSERKMGILPQQQ